MAYRLSRSSTSSRTKSTTGINGRRAASTAEELALCRLVLRLIDDYQRAHRHIPKIEPHELLKALLETSGKRQADIVAVFGSRSPVSEAVNGKRAISKAQAKRLGEIFNVSAAAFI